MAMASSRFVDIRSRHVSPSLTELVTLANTAMRIEDIGYYPPTWQALQEAISYALSVVRSHAPEQGQILLATQMLTSAMGDLVEWLNLDFVSGEWDDKVEFTRSTGGGRFNAQGQYEWIPADTPRIDYDPVTGKALGLLIEEQRTNLHLNSWLSNKTAGTLIWDIEPRLITPDGTANGVVWERTPSTGNWGHGHAFDTSSLVGKMFAGSVFIKPLSTSKSLEIYFGRSNATEGRRLFFSFTSDGGITTTSSDVKIIPYPNGWFRLCFWQICGGASTTIVYFPMSSEMKWAAWGLQIEEGSFPTSYIPTEGAQVTRAADIATVNELSPWFNSEQGTLFAEFTLVSPGPTRRHQHVCALSDGGFNNYIAIRKQSDSTIRGQVIVGGAIQFDGTVGAATSNVMKAAMAYKTNDFAMTQNGLTPAIDVSGTIPTVTKLDIGRLSGAGQELNGRIRSIRYYPRRLTGSELQEITA